MSELPVGAAELIKDQDGVISRQQLIGLGMTRAQAIQPVRDRRWQRVQRGVFVTYTGPPTELARVRAALLAAGPDAAAAYETALWLTGFMAKLPAVLQLCVPADRHVQAPRGARLFRRRDLDRLLQPGKDPARIRFEAAIIDVADRTAGLESVITLVLSAVQRRFTTAERLNTELSQRPRHRWRSLIGELLEEAQDGVLSALERRYLRDVERAHALPKGLRNKQRRPTPKHPYYDVDYREWNTIAELDGRAAHPPEGKFRDWRRDNAAAVKGDVVLRYGWADVAGHACLIAQQVAIVLRRNGWTAEPKRCRHCPPAAEDADVDMDMDAALRGGFAA